MKFPYDSTYEPAIPIIRVKLANAEQMLRTDTLEALIDTGSDGTLVPVMYLQQIVAPAVSEIRMRSHWGEWRTSQVFVVDLEVNGLILPGVVVVSDDQGDELVLGRNVLNKLILLLEGPNHVTDVR